jgi:hypothetical protein
LCLDGESSHAASLPMKAVASAKLAALLLLTPIAAAEPVRLASDGRALHPVIIADEASPSVKATAAELATYLGRITGAEFAVEVGDGSAGIVLGKATDFQSWNVPQALAADRSHVRNTSCGRLKSNLAGRCQRHGCLHTPPGISCTG